MLDHICLYVMLFICTVFLYFVYFCLFSYFVSLFLYFLYFFISLILVLESAHGIHLLSIFQQFKLFLLVYFTVNVKILMEPWKTSFTDIIFKTDLIDSILCSKQAKPYFCSGVTFAAPE